ncbi:hypothetical protein LIER_36065 [Lithospermum erythrorhizon]|uniref:Uncharacterized protein n=1 Tax=Lithospermum erythrorhizon TaxID=34254 RepID=A0AAV3P120_LITER
MVKARGGATSSSSKKGKSDRCSHEPKLVCVNSSEELIPLQVILPHESRHDKTPAKKPPTLLLPWKDDVAHDEPNPGQGE